MNRLVPSVLAWQGTDYNLFLLSMDDGWRRKGFIAGRYSQDGGVAVVKLVCWQIGRRLKESRSCEDIHKDELVAGIVTLLGEQDDSPLVYDFFLVKRSPIRLTFGTCWFTIPLVTLCAHVAALRRFS